MTEKELPLLEIGTIPLPGVFYQTGWISHMNRIAISNRIIYIKELPDKGGSANITLSGEILNASKDEIQKEKEERMVKAVKDLKEWLKL